jgi:hypothetical protein
VTNQPNFSNGLSCDKQTQYFNTTISKGKYTPVGVKGMIEVPTPLLPKKTVFEGVFGIKIDVAFAEYNSIPCEDLKGYEYVET